MEQTKDQDLVKLVHQAIEQEMETLGLDINISAHKGEITLIGIVDWLAEKQKAEEISRRVPGVVNVENGLTIALDGELTDRDIERQVMKKLEEGNLTQMGVGVHEGIVTIMGHSERADEEQAKDLIRHVRGVKEIVSKVH